LNLEILKQMILDEFQINQSSIYTTDNKYKRRKRSECIDLKQSTFKNEFLQYSERKDSASRMNLDLQDDNVYFPLLEKTGST
jgi:hypothetical protein